jgi:carbamoyl-phosphate synthase large subunit
MKVHEGRPHVGDLIVSGEVHLLINTPLGKLTQVDDFELRRTALLHGVPYTTTISAASAAGDAILARRSRTGQVRSLQAWHKSRPDAERWASSAADLFSQVPQSSGT